MQFSHKYALWRMLLCMCTLLAGLLFAACSSPLLDRTEQANMPNIDVTIANYSTQEGINALIAPTAYTVADIQKFTIDGEDKDGLSFQGTILTFEDNTATIQVSSRTKWELTLHAYSDEACTNEVLRGKTVADTSNGSVTVSFTLSTYNVTTLGNFSLLFTYQNDDITFTDAVDAVTIKLCDADTHAPLKERTLNTAADLALWEGSGFTYTSAENLAPGYYFLEVIFKKGSETIGMYTEILDIEPGRVTEKNITVTNQLFTTPAAPENVKVYRLKDSESPDYYTAIIRWDDVADNEDSYEISVYTYNSTGLVSPSNAETLTCDNYNTFAFVNGSSIVGYVSGNLWYGSQEIALRLKTGVLYDFTVAAVNSLGKSAATSRTASTDISHDADYQTSLYGYEASEESAGDRLHVNLFAISYNLLNGVWQTNAGTTTQEIMRDYSVYKNTSISLRIPETITTEDGQTYPICYFGSTNNPWTAWKNSTTGAVITQTSSWENLYVSAVYDINDVEYEITFDNQAVSLVATGTGGTTNAMSNTISSTSYNSATLSINRTGSNALFTDFKVYINGTEQGRTGIPADDSAATYTIPIPFKGKYTVQVAGLYNGNFYYSNEFTFTVN